MTQRKPAHLTWESFTEQLIGEAITEGKFDRLPGFGKPIPSLDEPYDENRWIREKLKEEKVESLPPGLALRKKVWQAQERILQLASEAEVRQQTGDLNAMIARENRSVTWGPAADVMPLEVDEMVARWREANLPHA